MTFASRINDYFVDAVWVFGHTGDSATRLAALTAGIVGQDEQR